MLGDAQVITFVATANPAEAKAFYEETLGLKLVDESPFAIEFSLNGIELRIQKVKGVSPAAYTALGWRVSDIGIAMDALIEKGVVFERFEGIPQDSRGVWESPAGVKVCWFKDPDGNTLSLTE